MSKNTRKRKASNVLVPIRNGIFQGRETIRLSEALRMIEGGWAKAEEITREVVNGTVNYRFAAISLTFKGYDKMVSRPKAKQTIAEERAMAASDACRAIVSIQHEEIYSGSREDGTAGPVIKTLRVMKKAKTIVLTDPRYGRIIKVATFQNWNERDRFHPAGKVFNPDHVPQPLVQRSSAVA